MRISGTAVAVGAVLLVGAAVVAVVMLKRPKAPAPAPAAPPAVVQPPAAKKPSTTDQVLGWGAALVGIAGSAHNAGLF